ncbi:MAG: pantetheine-phosphate adenylyltransferase [Bdellovibrionota bacterium]
MKSQKMIAVYPGFFDPFTVGHLNIVKRAASIFEEVVVLVASDSPKKAMFDFSDRIAMIREVLQSEKYIRVESFEGLLIDYMKKNGYQVIVRGLRTVSDYEYEFQMAQANRTMDEDVETLFLVTAPQYSHLSSTLIKEIARLGGDISKMVPLPVYNKMKKIKNP